MRISDWSSDVCSSDLCVEVERQIPGKKGSRIAFYVIRGPTVFEFDLDARAKLRQRCGHIATPLGIIMLTHDQEEISHILGRLLSTSDAARHAAEGGPTIDVALWSNPAELGFLGIVLPGAHGGADCDPTRE